ncbi:polysaccharide pyruvyl transferase family protein [Saccharomonospora sp. NPDC046836]|uniref:polysaccharide pyruvyl transferase family protein n=1 Tax=Saccharomonospora sp. NPDC046836 TaxID=3156921 RepID=UPI0033C5AA9C
MTRVGVFGLLGSGNLGNDGSLEAVLGYLRQRHPEAIVDGLCGGAEVVRSRYRIPAAPLNWNPDEYRTASEARAVSRKLLGKLVDAVRTARWVRGHDVVIVPGMGVLEATLPLRPWGFPYSLLLLCAAGRLFGTRVALVSVGADVIAGRATRSVVTTAARLATYRSYRDELSRAAMRQMGVDTSADEVYPDLAFALPVPATTPAPGTVGVGVMAYHGGNADRARAGEIHAAYAGKLERFVRWLVAEGYRVRLLTGDRTDEAVAARLVTALSTPAVTAASPSTVDELLREIAAVDAVVATRYHNVLCALKLGKPTVSIGYAAKNDALMAELGLGEFCQRAHALDVDRLIVQFTQLRLRSPELSRVLAERNAVLARRTEDQFAALSAVLFPGSTDESQPGAGHRRRTVVRTGTARGRAGFLLAHVRPRRRTFRRP